MKLLLLISVFLAVASLSYAIVSEGFFRDPEHPGKCVTNEKIILSPGEKVKDPSRDCGLIECVTKDGFTAFYACYGEGYDDDTKYGEYLFPDALYPKCCIRKVITH